MSEPWRRQVLTWTPQTSRKHQCPQYGPGPYSLTACTGDDPWHIADGHARIYTGSYACLECVVPPPTQYYWFSRVHSSTQWRQATTLNIDRNLAQFSPEPSQCFFHNYPLWSTRLIVVTRMSCCHYQQSGVCRENVNELRSTVEQIWTECITSAII